MASNYCGSLFNRTDHHVVMCGQSVFGVRMQCESCAAKGVFVPEANDLLTKDLADIINTAAYNIREQLTKMCRTSQTLKEYSLIEQKVRHDQQARIVQLELRNNNQTQTIKKYQAENDGLRQQIINLEKRSSVQANTINELLGDVPQ